jgi:VCBS repeat-containing protein
VATLTGTTNGDRLTGTSADDSIYGYGGNDTLVGMGGADYIDGGAGNDTITDSDGQTPDNFADTLVGGAGDDSIWAGYLDNADGGSGVDTLILRLDYAPGRINADWSNLWNGATYTIDGATIKNFEIIGWIVGSQYDDIMYLGTPAGKTGQMAGGGGADILYGGVGSDILQASGPSDPNDTAYDQLFGGAGDDTLWGGVGDYLDGGTGIDKVAFSATMSTVGVNLNFSKLIATGSDTIDGTVLVNVEDVIRVDGSSYDDSIDTSAAGHGVYLPAGAGNDTVISGAGADSIYGGAGADSVSAGGGNDYIEGGDGDDVIIGGLGADSVYGGAGADVFQFGPSDFSTGPNYDTIYDFTGAGDGAVAGEDIIKFVGFSNSATVVHVSDNGSYHTYDVVDGSFHGRFVVYYAGTALLQPGDYVFNAPPNTSADSYTTNEDSPLIVGAASGVLANDSDPNGDSITALLVSGPSHGTLSFAADGSFVYTPAANYFGTDSFTYTASDGQAQSAATTVSLTVNPVNDPPTATIANASYAANEQTSLTLKGTGLSVADVDAGSGTETVTLAVGEGVLNATAGDSGVLIGGAGTSTLTVSGTISQINAFLGVGGTSTLSFFDPSDAPSASTGLTLTIHDNGNTGGGDLSGAASSTIVITSVNDPPTAIAPAILSAVEQTSLNIKGAGLAIADPDAGSGSMSVMLSVGEGVLNANSGDSGAAVSGTGTSSLTVTGTLTQINALLSAGGTSTLSYFDPTDTPSTSTSLTLTVHDNGNTGGGDLWGGAVSTINITPVNDPPTISAPGAYSAIEQTVLVLKGTGLSIADPDAASGVMSMTLSVGEGVLNALVGDSGVSITGSGTSALTVTGTLTQLNSLLAAGGTSSLNYFDPSDTPAASTSLTLTVHDNGNTGGGDLWATTVSTIDITAVNDPPLANPDNAAATAGAAIYLPAINLLANDTDPEGDSLSVTGVQSTPTANGGTVTFASGVITYTAPSGYTGPDSFTYYVTDGHVTSPVAGTVNVTVTTGVNSVNGTSTNDVLDYSGSAVSQSMSGGSGDDTLLGGAGADTIKGGNGNDVLTGGQGMDLLNGGAGADSFVFHNGDFAGLTYATADRIADFTHSAGDIIDLSAVDAISGGADNAFTFIGTNPFTDVAGQLRYEISGSNTMIYGDLNGDGVADIAIGVTGVVSFVSSDFVL